MSRQPQEADGQNRSGIGCWMESGGFAFACLCHCLCLCHVLPLPESPALSVYRNELVNGKYCIVLLLSYQQGQPHGHRHELEDPYAYGKGSVEQSVLRHVPWGMGSNTGPVPVRVLSCPWLLGPGCWPFLEWFRG